MSLTQGLHAAVSGLGAVSRTTELVANNLANMRTPGYARREILLGTQALGGVQVNGVQRHADVAIIAERRIAEASLAEAQTRATFHGQMERWLGLPGDSAALSERIDRFDAALTTAAASPGSEARLFEVFESAVSLAANFKEVTAKIQAARQGADNAIASDVAAFNEALAKVAELNRSIVKMKVRGEDVSGLMDQRQALVDEIAQIIPLREINRDNGQIVLYSAGGATLLDGQPAIITASSAGIIMAESGALPGLLLNGEPVAMGQGGPLDGGRLTAMFTLRDQTAPQAQARLDAVARDLITRMAEVDPSAPALFDDGGLDFDPAAERGLAGRITVSALVDPAQGGALWRLRAGLGATTPNATGDGSRLIAMSDALQAERLPASGDFLPARRSLTGLAGTVLSMNAAERLAADSATSFASSRTTALRVMEAERGVDTDNEFQLMLQLEHAYAANSRVIQAVDRMLATLLEI